MKIRNWREEVRGRKTEVGGRKTEVGGRKTEVRRRRSEVGGLKTEDGGQKTEDGSQRMRARSSKLIAQGSRLQAVRSLLCIPLLFLMACGSGEKSNNENVHNRLDTKGLQQFSSGQRLYTQYCQNCHMENGEGLGKLIPPLKNSDYLLNNVAATARTIKYGLKGPIVVNGISYNQPMPANPDLTSLEITQLLVYISNAWGNETEPISIEAVEKVVPNQ